MGIKFTPLTTEQLWQKVLDDRGDCPSEDGRHAWIWLAAKSSAFHGISPDKAANLIRAALTRPEKHGEVDRAIQRAYNGRGTRFGTGSAASHQRAAYDESALSAVAANVTDDITEDW